MVKRESIISFMNYNYTPFSIKQCLIRIVLVWVLSALCCIGEFSWLIIYIIIFFDIAISAVFGTLMIKFSSKKISRYLCDGLFCLYVSIILNQAAYRVLTLLVDVNWSLSLIFLALLILCVCTFLILVFYNIKCDKYNIQSSAKKSFLFSFVGSGCGLLFAKLFLQDISNNHAILLVSILLLLLSFITSIGSLNLLKIFLLKYINKTIAYH